MKLMGSGHTAAVARATSYFSDTSYFNDMTGGMGSAYSLTSDEALMERVKKVCEEHLHMPVSSQLTTKSGGSEDVSYMMRRVQEQGGQATFMRVLTKEAGPGHSRIFDIDEKVLPNAVKIFCGTVYDIMK